VLEPVIDPGEEPMLPAPLLDTLAPVSMKLPPEEAELPAVPVAPGVPAPDAVLPAPDPETRQPVTTTVLLPLLLLLLLLLPVGSGVPPGVCAAAPAPSATAIIDPKRNCRFITRPPCWVNEVPNCAARSEGHKCKCGPTPVSPPRGSRSSIHYQLRSAPRRTVIVYVAATRGVSEAH
jgi:hypothetical protein